MTAAEADIIRALLDDSHKEVRARAWCELVNAVCTTHQFVVRENRPGRWHVKMAERRATDLPLLLRLLRDWSLGLPAGHQAQLAVHDPDGMLTVETLTQAVGPHVIVTLTS